MSGDITLDGSGPLLWQPALPVAVVKYDPSQADDEARFRLVPNVVCERIEREIGAASGTASFRYILDNSGLFPDWPSQFGDLWPQTAISSRYVVAPDDRIAAVASTDSGDRRLLFDGFAQIPQVDLRGDSQRVTFTATAAECRAWDVPIGGRLQRDATDPNGTSKIQTDLPVRFNPSDGRGGVLPNCTPDGHDVNPSDATKAYPIFLEEHLERSPDPRTSWTVSKAVRYILSTQADPLYFILPNMDAITAALLVKVPSASDGDGVIDPADASTYTTADMPLRDFDCSNRAWPDVLDQLLAMVGFGFLLDDPVDPRDSSRATVPLVIFRRDQPATTPRSLLLDEYGAGIDPTLNDVAGLALARDMNRVVNAWSVETPPRRHEVSIVLAPGFTPASGDETASNRPTYLRSRIGDASAATARKYRWYVADEGGDGHWDGASFTTSAPIDLSPIFPPDDKKKPTYVARLRPGAHRLLTLDSAGKPRAAMLHYSQDYAGDSPAVWDGTGTWKPIPGAWRLLEHRLGIEVTAEDPEQWFTGKGLPDLKGITWQANPPAGKRFWLLLTTVIDDDIMLPSVVAMRIASPTQYERRRRIDARDHYRLDEVEANSWFNQTADPVTIRDDTDRALDLARQYRTAHEMPTLSGSVAIPYITSYYRLADRVDRIDGRDVALRTNAAADKGEGARYPYVAKRVWSFAGDRQSTTLHLTDLRAEPRA